MSLINPARTAWLLGGAGAALLVAQAALPAMPDDAAGQVARVAAHRGAVVLSAAAFLVAGAFLIMAVAALNALAVERSRRVVCAGLVITAVGAIWPLAGRATYNLVLTALVGGDHAGAVAAVHAISASGSFNLLLVGLAAFVVGPVVLTVGLWRAGVSAPWPALLWLVGVVVVNAAEGSSRAVACLGMALAAGALVWLGTATRRGTSALVPVAAEPAVA